MKSLITAVALLASSALAANYAAGTICHSNVECNKNCLDAQFTVAEQDGGYVFVCDPSIGNPTQWYNLKCKEPGSVQNGDKTVVEATADACDSIGGVICSVYYCVISGKRSSDGDLRKAFSDACQAADESTFSEVKAMADEEAAKQFC